ncbi:MAG: hypothetical protein XD78_1244 [Desulfotomaculum sp. 46_296]|nr:MAG: hypothetical protein XD78_1244 [Desulfotomaculum sp. 46_296]
MELGALQAHSVKFGIGHPHAGRVLVVIELAPHLKAGGGSVGDEADDSLVAGKGATAPVLGDVGEEAVFHSVRISDTAHALPLAADRGDGKGSSVVADANIDPCPSGRRASFVTGWIIYTRVNGRLAAVGLSTAKAPSAGRAGSPVKRAVRQLRTSG